MTKRKVLRGNSLVGHSQSRQDWHQEPLERQQLEKSNPHLLRGHPERRCPWLLLSFPLYSSGLSMKIRHLRLPEILHHHLDRDESLPKEDHQGLLEVWDF